MTDSLNLDRFFFPDDQIINSYQGHKSFLAYKKGKNLRAKLTHKFGNIFEIQHNSLDTLSRAIELIHNATLTHDDVVDQSNYRRDEPTIHTQIGNKRAVLLGDYILAKALSELATLQSPRVLTEISLALKMLVDGEWMQFECQDPYSLDINSYEKLAINKTGALFSWCFIAPYSILGANEDKVEQLRAIGHKLGIIFQAQDDLLDFKDTLNKTSYLDFKNNNPNIVFSYLENLSIANLLELKQQSDYKKISVDLRSKFQSAVKKSNEYVDKVFQDLQKNIEYFRDGLSLKQSYQVQLLFDKLISELRKRET